MSSRVSRHPLIQSWLRELNQQRGIPLPLSRAGARGADLSVCETRCHRKLQILNYTSGLQVQKPFFLFLILLGLVPDAPLEKLAG